MMKKNKYTGKTKNEAIENAKIALQELEENLYIKELEVKNGLFSKKVEIEVIRKDDVIDFLKEYVKELVQNMGLNNVNLELKKQPDNIAITVYADNNSILIGKNGRTLEALTTITKQAIHKELGEYFHFTLDVSEYKIQQEKRLISLAKRVAREVASSKIPAKLDPMNSYERRIIHTALSENKKVMTESEGESPNRCVVIKPREEDK